jgi:hypothetical protein
MLGLAYNALVSSASSVSPWLQLLAPHQLADRAPIVTLDLRPSAQPSRVLVGGIDERYRAAYQWAAPAVVPNFHAFHVFDVTLCGQSLVANFTELMPLTAVIDTGASCLTLPAELFDAAVSWLPVTCVSQPFGAEKACTIAAASASTQLPDLGFVMGRDAASASAPLLLSVSNLLLPAAFTPLMTGTAWTPSTPPPPPSASLFWPSPSPASLPTASIGGDGSSRRLCMVRGPQLLGNEAQPSARQIVFGANAITDWQVVLAMHTAQVGIAQREPRAAPRVAQCNAPVRCSGQQDAYPAMRLCIDPDCARFAWWELDPVFRECRVRIDIQGALFAVAVAVMAIELFMHCRRLKLEAGVEQLAADQHRMNTEIAEAGDGDDGDDGLAMRDGAGRAAGGAVLHADDDVDGQYEDEW